MISAEVAVRSRPQLSMVQTFLEYKRMRRGRHIVRETTDYVASPEISDNRIIPDGAFILENIETGKRGLFFVEMDMATMRIASDIKSLAGSRSKTRMSLHRNLTSSQRSCGCKRRISKRSLSAQSGTIENPHTSMCHSVSWRICLSS